MCRVPIECRDPFIDLSAEIDWVDIKDVDFGVCVLQVVQYK